MKQTIPQEIGKRIRTRRVLNNMSQQDMAEELGITPSAYAKIERGETDPSITRLFSIAKILKVDVVELIKGEGMPPSENTGIEERLNKIRLDLDRLSNDFVFSKKNKRK